MARIPTTTVPIDLGQRSYPIRIGTGLLPDASSYQQFQGLHCALIVTNSTVAPLYLRQLGDALSTVFKRVVEVILPDGETYKNWETLNTIFDALLSAECDRKTVLFALGGGVVGDMTGFAAATYMRGVEFVQIPTTLLAQVDSSVGGKTGVNHPLGKNMVGAFHQPRLVLCDLDVLHSLPEREFSAGLAEVIKYGPIYEIPFLAWLEEHMDALMARDLSAVAYAVRRSCEIKALVVSQDEREGGMRAILNFGHTFGHAIEAGLGYGVWLHGEAIASGMVMAAELSKQLGLIPAAEVSRLKNLIARAKLPVRGPILVADQNAERYLALMRIDKKAQHGSVRFVVIDGKGNAVLRTADDAMVRNVVDACCA